MGVVLQHDIAALAAIRRLSDKADATAGGAGNNTLVDGYSLDREGFAGGSLPNTALLGILFTATLAATKTLSIAVDVQHSADGSTWVDYATQAATVVATGPTGGGTVTGQLPFGVDLTGANRFVRVNFTPDLSATATDTAELIACGAFGGFDTLPAPL